MELQYSTFNRKQVQCSMIEVRGVLIAQERERFTGLTNVRKGQKKKGAHLRNKNAVKGVEYLCLLLSQIF